MIRVEDLRYKDKKDFNMNLYTELKKRLIKMNNLIIYETQTFKTIDTIHEFIKDLLNSIIIIEHNTHLFAIISYDNELIDQLKIDDVISVDIRLYEDNTLLYSYFNAVVIDKFNNKLHNITSNTDITKYKDIKTYVIR